MSRPKFRSLDDVNEIEKTPIENRLSAKSTYELLGDASRRFGEKPALTFLPNGRVSDTPQTYSYKELGEHVTRTANWLHDCGARPGRSVSILMPNRPETHFCIWGAQATTAANPINPFLNAEHIAVILREANSSHLVFPGPSVDHSLWQKAQSILERGDTSIELLVIDGDSDTGASASIGRQFSESKAYVGDSLESRRNIRPNDVAAFFHTGGTTGTPKLAQHTHTNEVVNAWMAGFAVGFEEDDVTLTGLPLFHANAALLSGLTAFSSGVHVILAGQNGFRSEKTIHDFWKLVEKYQVTNFSGVPTLYSTLLNIDSSGVDLSSLRFGICGAAPMPKALFSDFQKRTGIRILEAYGMTESTAMSTCNPRDGDRRVGSVGVRVPYQQAKTVILDENGNWVRDARVDEVGVICLKGPNVISGYTSAAANENLWVKDDWLNTGDLARIDEDGYFWLTGREKDLIIRSGHNIDPMVIEEAMNRHPAIEAAAAIGKPDAYAGELPVVYVTLVDGEEATEQECLEYARETVAERPAWPKEVVIIDEMPVTAVGKIFKPSLRADALTRVVSDELSGMTNVQVFEVVNDKKLGLLVQIDSAEATRSDRQEINRRLEKYSFPVRFVSVPGEDPNTS